MPSLLTTQPEPPAAGSAGELALRSFSLMALIDDLAATRGPAARTRGLHLDIHYDRALPLTIRADQARLRQVLAALLDNAIRFTIRGSVTLCASMVCDQLHIEVRDTGIGIERERLETLFEARGRPGEPAQGDAGRAAASRLLAERMGGRLWAETTPGEGSTFHVLLPLAEGGQPRV